MDLQNMDLKGGSLQISTEVIGKIARCAALEVDGVSEAPAQAEQKGQGAAGCCQHPAPCYRGDAGRHRRTDPESGGQVGAKIPAVAEKVQENVKSAVQNMTNVTVSRVNLVIAGLAAEEQE